MLNVLNDVLLDVEELAGVSTVGDRAFLRTLTPLQVQLAMASLLDQLLVSVERRNRVFTPVEALSERQNGSLKNFLRSLWSRVFDPVTGAELKIPSRGAFSLLYQVYSLLAKYGSGYVTKTMERDAVDSYLRVESDMQAPIWDTDVLRVAKEEISRVLSYASVSYKGKHGPGSVAEGPLSSGRKYEWFASFGVEPCELPALERYLALGGQIEGVGGFYLRLRMSRWCAVPKTWRKCRAICAEPAILQYLQQSLGRQIAYALSICPLCNVDIRDQSTNASVALEASSHGYYATLDLSSASDRLSLQVVRDLLPMEWSSILTKVRSERTELPNGAILELLKFGSMGNATTFPVQSLVYWAITVAVNRLSGLSIAESRLHAYAYGDDLICPSSCAQRLSTELSAVGLKVNADKSFSSGSFRESCGVHAYAGLNVTPTYLRTLRLSDPELVSLCSCANGLLSKGFKRAAEGLFLRIEAKLSARLPTVSAYDVAGVARSVQLCRLDFDGLSTHELVEVNESRGVRVKVDRYQYLVVRAFGLYELKSKRRANVLRSTADLWDLIGDCDAGFDRGHIPGGVALSLRNVRLL